MHTLQNFFEISIAIRWTLNYCAATDPLIFKLALAKFIRIYIRPAVCLSVCQYSYLYLSRIFLFEVFPHYQQQLNAGPGPFLVY